MHTPAHFAAQGAEMIAATLAVGAVGVAATKARKELRSPNADGSAATPLARAGLVAATTGLIFATQMLNFPISSGTSGHLLGGALAAALLGPWTGLLSISAVLLVQTLLFADGAVASLGVNITTMGIVGVLVGWGVTSLAMRTLRSSRVSATLASALGALVSVPAAALALSALVALPGAAAPVAPFTAQMLPVHVAIGLGEAGITALLVAAVLAVNPSLSYIGRRYDLAPARAHASRPATIAGIGATALIVAGALARFASPHPDGLEFVSRNLGVDMASGSHALLAEYGAVAGLDVGVAGVIGVVTVAALAFAATWLLAGRPARAAA